MKTTIQEKLQWLVDGNQLIDEDECKLFLMSVNLAEKISEEPVSYDESELEGLEIYIHPLQTEVERLMYIIKTQTKELEKMVQEKNAKPERSKYQRLTKTEIAEAAQAVVDDKTISTNSLANKYKCSSSTMARHLENMKVRIPVKSGPRVKKS